MSSKFTDKTTLIERMLAKAESTTPEEAEALTAAAERLMVKHGIDAAVIAAKRAANDKPEQVVTETITYSGTYVDGLTLMATQVVEAFGTMRCYRSYTSGRSQIKTFHIVGFESDVAQAKVLVESLHLQVIVAMRAWWKNNPERSWLTAAEARNARRHFIIAFGEGAAERIKSETATIVAQDTTGSTELALLDRGAQAEAALPTGMRKSRPLMGGRAGAADAGRNAGRTANVGTTALGGRARALTGAR